MLIRSGVDNGPAPRTSRGPQRRREIVAAAERVFLAHGFADATTLMVATEAGASKETIYRFFGSKEELFAEVIETRSKWLSQELDADLSRVNDVRAVLHEFGCRLLGCMISDEVVSLTRVVFAETQHNPELGRLFLKHGPERTQHRLALFIENACGRGELHIDDPAMAARVFLSLVLGDLAIKNLCRVTPTSMSPDEIDTRVQLAANVFLSHYGRCHTSWR